MQASSSSTFLLFFAPTLHIITMLEATMTLYIIEIKCLLLCILAIVCSCQLEMDKYDRSYQLQFHPDKHPPVKHEFTTEVWTTSSGSAYATNDMHLTS